MEGVGDENMTEWMTPTAYELDNQTGNKSCSSVRFITSSPSS